MIQGMILFIRSHPQLFAEYNPKSSIQTEKKIQKDRQSNLYYSSNDEWLGCE